jgi:hypothetical protein
MLQLILSAKLQTVQQASACTCCRADVSIDVILNNQSLALIDVIKLNVSVPGVQVWKSGDDARVAWSDALHGQILTQASSGVTASCTR